MPETGQPFDEGHLPTKLGTDFISAFYRLLRGATLYNRKNDVIERLTQECLQAIHSALKLEGRLSLKIVRDNFFFNNSKIQVNVDQYAILKTFLQEMKNRWIGEVEFTEEVQGEQLKDFVYLLSGLEANNESNYLLLMRHLEQKGIDAITVGKLEVFKDEEVYVDSKEKRQFSKEVFFKSINMVKEVVDSVRHQKLVNIRKAKRLMQNAVNAIAEDESTLLGLANIKNYDEYTFNHSVNVAIYSIAIGQRIGIPKRHLSYLGMAALFHDIGKIRVPREILSKPSRLSPEELALVRYHPIFGVEAVMAMKEWGELSSRMMDAAFEHHLKYDLTGYPKPTRKRKLTLFGRIIAIADFYDTLVRPRGGNRFPYVSEKILGIMLERSGKDFDPALVKVFINMIGVFPLGTLVLLNTNEIGIVVQIQEDSEHLDRPKVNLLHYSNGEYRKGEIVDLREMDEKTGEFKRSIVRTLDPNQYQINVSEFII
ncbi:MAG: HD-GYP domain-containing protein [Syntrophaceae bacterium]|nr:HD-GYP domain-containing protein [Syntrophaceae bacterium]